MVRASLGVTYWFSDARARSELGYAPRSLDDGLRTMVFEVLVKQLGHRPSEAVQLIDGAFRRKPGMTTPEELFDEIYRGAGRA